MLYLTNTLTGKKEQFVPRKKNNSVSMYACGITPYDHSHIGHARSAVSFDLLYRVLCFIGYDVVYCRNFTDIDDKLLVKAEQVYGDQHRYPLIADVYIREYKDVVSMLNCIEPRYQPKVTDNIAPIIAFIDGLIKKGYAYVVDGDVYFRINRFDGYGKLSHRTIDQLCSGNRVGVEPNKEHPFDFALWKSEPDHSFWESPWGFGRPGWHIECSALAAHYLDKHIDIHGGGIDILFPHHENEIAQSESLHEEPLATYWVHNGMVHINHEKMSKSLGNVVSIVQLLNDFDPMVVRFYLLSHHYRSPLDFSYAYITNTQKAYERLCRIFQANYQIPEDGMVLMSSSVHVQRACHFLYDDLNSAGMIGYLFETINEWESDPAVIGQMGYLLKKVCGLTLLPLVEKEPVITKDIQVLLDEREQARAQKNWARADQIRDELLAQGFKIQDKKL